MASSKASKVQGKSSATAKSKGKASKPAKVKPVPPKVRDTKKPVKLSKAEKIKQEHDRQAKLKAITKAQVDKRNAKADKLKKPIKKAQPKKPVKPVEPKGDILGLIEWGPVNHKAGIVVQGVGTESGNRYHILMSKRKKDWIVRMFVGDNMKADKEIKGLEKFDKCKLQCVAWENGFERRIARVPETAEVDRVEDLLLRLRSWEGLRPLYNPETARLPIGRLKRLTKFSLVNWIEDLLDYYEERNLWLTNSALRNWQIHMNQIGWVEGQGKNMSETDDRLVSSIFNEAIRCRPEPEVYSDNYRRAAFFRAAPPTTNGHAVTPEPEVNTIVSVAVAPPVPKPGKADSHKHGIDIKSSVGRKGGRRYNIEGHPITAIIRWMGSELWTRKEVQQALKELELDVQEATIIAQISSGKQGEDGHHGKIPELSEELKTKLRAIIGE